MDFTKTSVYMTSSNVQGSPYHEGLADSDFRGLKSSESIGRMPTLPTTNASRTTDQRTIQSGLQNSSLGGGYANFSQVSFGLPNGSTTPTQIKNIPLSSSNFELPQQNKPQGDQKHQTSTENCYASLDGFQTQKQN